MNIFLHEGLLDEAIAVVQTASGYYSQLVHQVMDAVMTHRPEWVIERACHNAEEIMNAGKASHYMELFKHGLSER